MILLRALSTIAALYVAACLGLVGWQLRAGPAPAPSTSHGDGRTRLPQGSGAAWFARVRPSCNSLEVESMIASDPPPISEQGTAYAAACLAIGGKVDRARVLLQGLPEGRRSGASDVLFEIGHAVADGGDERSAEPLLSLVLEFQPDNPMALFHVGMSEFGRYERKAAHGHLKRFLEIHTEDDLTRQAAERALPYTEDE